MKWNECEESFIRKVETDENRISSIIEMALQRLSVAKSIKQDEKTISFVIESYYEVIKELLVAYMLKNGLRSKNHQCLISYFYKTNPEYEKEAHLIAQMSYYRNRLDYYGEQIPSNFYNKNKDEFEKLIRLLLNMLKVG